MIPVLLSGGIGSRLWPLSRELYPKQFISLWGAVSMLEKSIGRVRAIRGIEAPLVVCNEEHRFLVAEQLRDMGVRAEAIILEPEGRNTAPATALAALQACDDGSDPLLLIMPADHYIGNELEFIRSIEKGRYAAEQGKIVVFGVTPKSPCTGYGYIKVDGSIERKGGRLSSSAYPVLQFVEKPAIDKAEDYVQSGEYYWNSGIFLFRAHVFLNELERYAPEILDACKNALKVAKKDLDFLRVDVDAFRYSPSDSIDYAVMEKTNKAMLVPMDADWSDVGSWDSLWEVGEKDENNNVSSGDVILEDTSGALVRSEGSLIAAVGVENLVIVEAGDAVLVLNKDRAQDVKKVVERLKLSKRKEVLYHRSVPRPWGSYECIDVAERFQVKRISVRPGERLSLQLHHHRAEHWIVVSGVAKVTRGDEQFVLGENESTFIPIGTKHRLENPGKIPLELIEVQSGSYLGEDDIVRFEDTYGRVDPGARSDACDDVD